MADKKLLYLAPFFRLWDDIELQSPIGQPVSFQAPPGNPGVCLVFDSMEAMKEVYPDVEEGDVLVFQVPVAKLERTRCPHCGTLNKSRCLHCRKLIGGE